MLIVVGIGIRSLTNIVLIRLGFQYLGEAQFGLWVLMQSLVSYLNLSDLGVGQGIMNAQAVNAENRDRAGAVRVLSSGALIFAVVAVAVWGISNLVVVSSPGLWTSAVLSHAEFKKYFILLSALSLAALPISAFSASLGGLRDLTVRYAWDISLVIAVALTTSIMFITGQNMLAVLATPLAVQLAWYTIPVGLVAIRHSGVSFSFAAVSRDTVRGLVGSSSFIFLMSLALLTQRYSANFITGTLVSVEAVAQVHPHIVLYQIFGWALVDAATRAMLPFITGIGVRGDETRLKFITTIAAKVSTFAAACFSLGIWILGQQLMWLWLKKDVFLGLPIVGMLSLIFILDSPAAVFTNISIATERHRARAITNLGYAISTCAGGVIGVLIASPGNAIFGMFAGFLSISVLFHFVIYPVIMKYDLNIAMAVWFKSIILQVVAFFVGTAVVTYWIHTTLGHSWVAMLASAVVAIVSAIGFVSFGLFTKDERQWLRQRLRRTA